MWSYHRPMMSAIVTSCASLQPHYFDDMHGSAQDKCLLSHEYWMSSSAFRFPGKVLCCSNMLKHQCMSIKCSDNMSIKCKPCPILVWCQWRINQYCIVSCQILHPVTLCPYRQGLIYYSPSFDWALSIAWRCRLAEKLQQTRSGNWCKAAGHSYFPSSVVYIPTCLVCLVCLVWPCPGMPFLRHGRQEALYSSEPSAVCSTPGRTSASL